MMHKAKKWIESCIPSALSRHSFFPHFFHQLILRNSMLSLSVISKYIKACLMMVYRLFDGVSWIFVLLFFFIFTSGIMFSLTQKLNVLLVCVSRPPDPITHLTVCNNFLVMAMSSNILLRLDLEHPDQPDGKHSSFYLYIYLYRCTPGLLRHASDHRQREFL